MNAIKVRTGKVFNALWFGVTVLIGIGMLSIVVYPPALKWIGVNLSDESVILASRVFLATAAWFIIGHNRVTQPVADIEKSGPLATIAAGVLVGIILEGAKLLAILQKAGFGMLDIALMVAGIIAILGGLFWAFATYFKRS